MEDGLSRIMKNSSWDSNNMIKIQGNNRASKIKLRFKICHKSVFFPYIKVYVIHEHTICLFMTTYEWHKCIFIYPERRLLEGWIEVVNQLCSGDIVKDRIYQARKQF